MIIIQIYVNGGKRKRKRKKKQDFSEQFDDYSLTCGKNLRKLLTSRFSLILFGFYQCATKREKHNKNCFRHFLNCKFLHNSIKSLNMSNLQLQIHVYYHLSSLNVTTKKNISLVESTGFRGNKYAHNKFNSI